MEIIEQDSVDTIIETQNKVVNACKEIVENTAVTLQGKKYVCVEGWQAIAVAHGCFAGSDEVEEVFRADELVGWKARGYIKRGEVMISTAQGFCGVDEEVAQAEYAGRAMAQTRAISRACRSAFAHIVVMINQDLKTTPAEEVPKNGFAGKQKPATKKQIEFLKSLGKGNKKYLRQIAKYYNREKIEDLTKSEASDAIEKIKKQEAPIVSNHPVNA